MRLKGINPFEQHAEKFVAGLFALGLLGVVAWQFLGPASKVKVGTEEVNPPEAYEKLAANAKRVEDSIKRQQELPEGADKVTQAFDNFGAKLGAPVAPHPELAIALDKPVSLGVGLNGGGAGNTAMNELQIPAPLHAMAAGYMSTVAPSEQQNADVAKVLPAAAPFDKASVTVEALFDGTALKQALAIDPDGSGPVRAIPANWFSSGMQILGVELHRQTMKADGTWTEAEKIKQIPGRALFVDDADTLNDAAKLKVATTFATDNSEFVRRTPFYAAQIGEKWASPSERESKVDVEGDKSAQVKLHQNQLKKFESDLKLHTDQLSKVGQAPAPTGGGGGGGGGKGAAGGGGGAGSGGGRPGPSGPNPADELRKKQLQTMIARDQEKIEGEKKALRELGAPVEGDTAAAIPVVDPNAKPKPATPVLDDSAIKLWAHDVFVERGRTYRYQVVVILNNPYFGHSPAMVPGQADKLAKAGVLRSPASDWTDPVTVDPETYLFFTAANEDDPAGGRSASARAELYQFKWGYWRRGIDSLQPGDTVAADISVPDFSKILAAAPTDPNNPPMPVAPSGGGGKGAAVGGTPPPTPNRPDAPATPTAQVPRVKVSVGRDEIMLGVGQGPIRDNAGKSKPAPQVYLKDVDGLVKIVVPELEKSDAAYLRVSRSAEKGERELTPNQDKNKPLPTLPNTNTPGVIPPQQQGGRGG